MQVLTPQQAALWQELLPACRNVFGSLEFATTWQEHAGYHARLLVAEAGGQRIVYPWFLRPVSELPFAEPGETGWVDTLSPEYTGPLSLEPLPQAAADEFRHCLAAYCREAGIVSEFAHLHPWHCQTAALIPEDVAFDREIVYVDLAQSEHDIWNNSLTHACRKNINRARREGVVVAAAQTQDDIREFHRVYLQTMERNSALARYFYPLDFFWTLFQRMPQHTRFVLAWHQDRVVAGTLYLHDDLDVYSYLGGADHACQHLRPTNAVVYETLCWAQSQGKKRLILGGGYRPDDGIHRFKASFSPLRARFHVYRHIHLPGEYAALCARWASYYGSDLNRASYFPAYRSLVPGGVTDEP